MHLESYYVLTKNTQAINAWPDEFSQNEPIQVNNSETQKQWKPYSRSLVIASLQC